MSDEPHGEFMRPILERRAERYIQTTSRHPRCSWWTSSIAEAEGTVYKHDGGESACVSKFLDWHRSCNLALKEFLLSCSSLNCIGYNMTKTRVINQLWEWRWLNKDVSSTCRYEANGLCTNWVSCGSVRRLYVFNVLVSNLAGCLDCTFAEYVPTAFQIAFNLYVLKLCTLFAERCMLLTTPRCREK